MGRWRHGLSMGKDVCKKVWNSMGDIMDEDFLALYMPQLVSIQNPRLGAFKRVLQVLVIGLVVFYASVRRVWLRSWVPADYSVELWRAPLGKPQAGGLDAQMSPLHCTEPWRFWIDSRGYRGDRQYRPTGCESSEVEQEMASEQAVISGDLSGLFVPTFVMENNSWTGSGPLCSQDFQIWCVNATYGSFTQTNNSCSCTTARQRFLQRPEEQMVFLAHAYQVDVVDNSWTDHPHVVRGHSMSDGHLQGARGNLNRMPGNLVTVIKKSDGTPCFVGGKSVWEFNDAKYGIGGSLADWLSCAQVTLDTMEAEPIGPRHLRTTGVTLRLIFDYQSGKHDENSASMSCILTVDYFPRTTTLPAVYDFFQVPTPFGGYDSKHVKNVYGVAFTTRATGRYSEFNFAQMLSAFVEMFVIFQLPSMATRLIALYFFGHLSEIYRRARRTKLNVHDHFQDAISKMMVAAMGFRGLMGGIWSGSSSEIEGLTLRSWHSHMLDLFHNHIDSGALGARQLKHMALITFKHMDRSESGKITCHDFIRSCSSHDTFDVDSLTRLLAMRESLFSGVLDSAYVKMHRSLTQARENDRRCSHEAAQWTATIASIAAANKEDGNTDDTRDQLPQDFPSATDADDDIFPDLGSEQCSNPDLLQDFGTEQLQSTDPFRDFHGASGAAAVADDIQALGSSGVESLLMAAGTSAHFGAVQQGDTDVLRRIKALEDACIESRIAALEAKHRIGDYSCVAAMAVDACASADPECERILEIDDRPAPINDSKDPKSRKQPVDHLRRSVEDWEDQFKTQLEAERVARLRGQNTMASVFARQFGNAIVILEQRLAVLESQMLPSGRLSAWQVPPSEPEAELPSQSSVGQQEERPMQSRIHEQIVPATMVGRRNTEELPQNRGDGKDAPLSPSGLMRPVPLASAPSDLNTRRWFGAVEQPRCSSRPLRSTSSSAGAPPTRQPQSLGQPGPASAGPPVPRVAKLLRGATTTLSPRGVFESPRRVLTPRRLTSPRKQSTAATTTLSPRGVFESPRRVLTPQRLVSPRKQSAAAAAAIAVSTTSAACDNSGSSNTGLQPQAPRPPAATAASKPPCRACDEAPQFLSRITSWNI